MADRYLEWLETAQVKKPALKEQLIELGSLYQKRLWHQLTLALEKQIKSPAFKKDSAFLPELYNRFIIGFAYRLNPLKLAMIAEEVAKEYSQASEAGKAFHQCLQRDVHQIVQQACNLAAWNTTYHCTARNPCARSSRF